MTFGEVAWAEEDIENALELYDVEPTLELVSEVISRCIIKDRIQDAMIESGWDVIYSIIDEIKEERGDI